MPQDMTHYIKICNVALGSIPIFGRIYQHWDLWHLPWDKCTSLGYMSLLWDTWKCIEKWQGCHIIIVSTWTASGGHSCLVGWDVSPHVFFIFSHGPQVGDCWGSLRHGPIYYRLLQWWTNQLELVISSWDGYFLMDHSHLMRHLILGYTCLLLVGCTLFLVYYSLSLCVRPLLHGFVMRHFIFGPSFD